VVSEKQLQYMQTLSYTNIFGKQTMKTKENILEIKLEFTVPIVGELQRTFYSKRRP
jgi:hypothetical protein